jgi:hypothetical protein
MTRINIEMDMGGAVKSRSSGLLIGGIVGALLGLTVAWILLDDEGDGEEVGPGGGAPRARLRPGDAINLTVGAIGVIRQIAALRQR